MLASCSQQGAMLSDEERARRDSLALPVGVIPCADCLPIYYAQQMGLFDSAGVYVRLVEYQSQMDLDTAIMGKHVDLAYTDLPRTIEMAERGCSLDIVGQLPGVLHLVGARTKRIRNLKQLNERMVAVDRLSNADYWSDQLMSYAGLDREAIFRPQVNDLQLRLTMLTSQLVDAALLPEPYASVAALRGQKPLWHTPDSGLHLACLVMPTSLQGDTLRTRQRELFLQVYDVAAARILDTATPRDSITALLHRHYGIDRKMADTLRLKGISSLLPADEVTKQEISVWSANRKKVK